MRDSIPPLASRLSQPPDRHVRHARAPASAPPFSFCVPAPPLSIPQAGTLGVKLHFVLAWRLRAEASGGGQLSFRKVAPGHGAAASADHPRSHSLAKIAELGTHSENVCAVLYLLCEGTLC